MTTRQLRLLRAASASSAATVLAALSHTFAGGAAPHPLLIVAVTVLLLPLAALLIGARVSKPRVALTVLVSQAAFHVIFQLLGAPTGLEEPTGSAAAFGHHHELLRLGPVSVAGLPDLAMIAGHVLAAAVTIALIWHGESLVRTIAAWVLALVRLDEGPVPADHRRPAALVSHRHPLVDAALDGTVSRRGPPLFS